MYFCVRISRGVVERRRALELGAWEHVRQQRGELADHHEDDDRFQDAEGVAGGGALQPE